MNTVSWAHGRGVITSDGAAMTFTERPDLSFGFDAFYFEGSLMKKVIDDIDYPLSLDEIAEIQAWLQSQLELPLLVNGIDAQGNYLEGVPASAVFKTVTIPPPSPTGWRYDFAAAEAGGDHWVQVS
jgi:hypothetical protein